ncbi:hypothetical protein FVE85_7592 [Porphyridium purpureum]|uniref:Uncharacterized protein n=1 Tax=Porphyridium purpureum TaxID=35688 RepID=A0A5J4ZBH7_PORPP|nr:hypothetical protein FVE85_7592 [Porphyridium purpureum]|eukprot:POR4193..scf295_1
MARTQDDLDEDVWTFIDEILGPESREEFMLDSAKLQGGVGTSARGTNKEHRGTLGGGSSSAHGSDPNAKSTAAILSAYLQSSSSLNTQEATEEVQQMRKKVEKMMTRREQDKRNKDAKYFKGQSEELKRLSESLKDLSVKSAERKMKLDRDVAALKEVQERQRRESDHSKS